jgi:RAQPRD family integrative conjugative element protein
MKCLMIVMGLLYVSASFAGADAATEDEKRYLIKITQELQHLDELAVKAANKADPDARITLDYVALRHDLQEIQRALVDHINNPSRTPRMVDSLTLAGN